MSTENSLAHTKWECKYHVVFAPKYRRQVIYKSIRADIGQILGMYVRQLWKIVYRLHLDNAKKCAGQNPGYKVFDADGKVVYEPKATKPAVKVPFFVKFAISDLNIRKNPGTDYSRVQFCPGGVYTIVEVKSGKGSTAGWGRLKSGIG